MPISRLRVPGRYTGRIHTATADTENTHKLQERSAKMGWVIAFYRRIVEPIYLVFWHDFIYSESESFVYTRSADRLPCAKARKSSYFPDAPVVASTDRNARNYTSTSLCDGLSTVHRPHAHEPLEDTSISKVSCRYMLWCYSNWPNRMRKSGFRMTSHPFSSQHFRNFCHCFDTIW